MKVFGKITAVAAAAVAAVGLCAAANAASTPAATPAYDDYTNFYDTKVGDQGGHAFTDEVRKRDYYDYAVVYITSGAFHPESGRIQTYNQGNKPVTEMKDFPTNTRYELKYDAGEGIYWDYYKLCLSSQRFGFVASGKWAP